MLQATAEQALTTISGRFASIQQLISAIGGARDQKGILDLQARISAEQGMLANDQTKLQVLYQAAQAQQWALQQRNVEQAINDVGSLRRPASHGDSRTPRWFSNSGYSDFGTVRRESGLGSLSPMNPAPVHRCRSLSGITRRRAARNRHGILR